MIGRGWVQLCGAPGRQMTLKFIMLKLVPELEILLGGRPGLGHELGFGERCPMGADGRGSFGTSLPHRSGCWRWTLAGKHAVVSVPDSARIALAAWLALAPAWPRLLVVLTRAAAWRSTGGVVRATWAMHAFTVSRVLPVYLNSCSATLPGIGIQRVTVALVRWQAFTHVQHTRSEVWSCFDSLMTKLERTLLDIIAVLQIL